MPRKRTKTSKTQAIREVLAEKPELRDDVSALIAAVKAEKGVIVSKQNIYQLPRSKRKPKPVENDSAIIRLQQENIMLRRMLVELLTLGAGR